MLIVIIGVILVFVLFALIIGGISQSCTNRKIEKKSAEFNTNISIKTNAAKDVNANIANLELQDAGKSAEVNIRREDLSNARNETNLAQENTNRALSEANNIRNSNRSGVSADELKKKAREVY